MDTVFFLSIFLVFVGTLVGSFVRERRFARHLRHFAPERQPAGAAEAPQASPELPGLMLVFTRVREAYGYVSRSLGTVRHGNEFLERAWSPWG